jgi:hypothetical protein
MSEEKQEKTPERTLAHRIESVGWALFLIMIGCLWLVPGSSVPEGTWLIGAGVIMIGVNVVKRGNGLPMNPFSIGVGVVAIGLGVAGVFEVELPFFAILLIAVGANIIIKLLGDWLKR